MKKPFVIELVLIGKINNGGDPYDIANARMKYPLLVNEGKHRAKVDYLSVTWEEFTSH